MTFLIFIMKDLSKIIREFDKLTYNSYERRRPNHYPTDSYFYLTMHLVKCMMRADALNSDNYPLRTAITGAKKFRSFTIFLQTIANQKSFEQTKTHCRSILRTKTNQKDLSLIKVLRRRANQNASTKA